MVLRYAIPPKMDTERRGEVIRIMEMGEEFLRWSVRVAMLGYVLALVLRLSARNRSVLTVARALWVIGLVAFVVHVASAFYGVHHWSHAEAEEFTARDTESLIGWRWGGGIWANYLFAVVWFADAIAWLRGLERYERRPTWVEAMVQGYLGFIAFNAVVVFPTGPVRWCGIAATVLVLGLLIARLRSRS
jgi:hypothetical protein